MVDWLPPTDPRIQNLDQRPPRPQLLRWRIEPFDDPMGQYPVQFFGEWDVDGEVRPYGAKWVSDTLLSDAGVWNSMMNIIKPGSAN